jgi:hypothetical protein
LFPTISLSDNSHLAALPSLLILNVVRVAEDRIFLGPYLASEVRKFEYESAANIKKAVSATF